ncbi:MAG: c-type cytochrome [Planctomycetota bacterium]
MNFSPRVLLVPALGLVLAACERPATHPSTDPIARGRYLVNAMGCADCHSPHGPDGAELPGMHLAGHPADAPLPKWEASMLQNGNLATIGPTVTAYAGPWGVSIAPNLTPDATGMAELTADALVKSWKTGRHWKEDRMVMPPMPVPALRNLEEEDMRAIWAYLHSLPAVKNAAPRSVVAPR